MATEYGITSFVLAGDVDRGTSVWFVDTARQKSRSRSTKVDTNRDKRDRRNTVKRITKFWMVPSVNTTNLQRYSCAINYPVLPPNTAYNSNIQSISLQYSPFPTLHVPIKTRWNSVFDCINRALQLKDAITRFSENGMELDGRIDGEDDENPSVGEVGRVVKEMVCTTHPHSLLLLYIYIQIQITSGSTTILVMSLSLYVSTILTIPSGLHDPISGDT